jgi:hypothetical protein
MKQKLWVERKTKQRIRGYKNSFCYTYLNTLLPIQKMYSEEKKS